MKESYVEELATHDSPESCGGARKRASEALTGVRAGWVLSREMRVSDADLVGEKGRRKHVVRKGENDMYPAWSLTPGMYGTNLRENRERLRAPESIVRRTTDSGRIGNPQGARR